VFKVNTDGQKKKNKREIPLRSCFSKKPSKIIYKSLWTIIQNRKFEHLNWRPLSNTYTVNAFYKTRFPAISFVLVSGVLEIAIRVLYNAGTWKCIVFAWSRQIELFDRLYQTLWFSVCFSAGRILKVTTIFKYNPFKQHYTRLFPSLYIIHSIIMCLFGSTIRCFTRSLPIHWNVYSCTRWG